MVQLLHSVSQRQAYDLSIDDHCVDDLSVDGLSVDDVSDVRNVSNGMTTN